MPTNVGLRRDTGRLARYVGAQNFPQPNMMLFISKYILELNLPSKFKIRSSSYPALAPAPVIEMQDLVRVMVGAR